MLRILVTGAAGFVGFHLCRKIAQNKNYEITGADIISGYYDTALKYARLEELGFEKSAADTGALIGSSLYSSLKFRKCDISDRESVEKLFSDDGFDLVINLAAQAGVRYSIENPQSYIDANVTGFLNILEECRKSVKTRLIYASSSSVYGSSGKQPFSESENTDSPVSMYAATKKSNELMANVYFELYRLKSIGLRFFTVYGPWGRPDMAYYKFADKIMRGESIDVYNNGKMKRDFTYVDDIILCIERIIKKFTSDEIDIKCSIYNIGRGKPENLEDFISVIERNLDKKAVKNYLPMQPGDVVETYADVSGIEEDFDYKPRIDLDYGIREFITWFKKYNRLY